MYLKIRIYENNRNKWYILISVRKINNLPDKDCKCSKESF